jgi:hypothetical protein
LAFAGKVLFGIIDPGFFLVNELVIPGGKPFRDSLFKKFFTS